jgi:hypothetical protein
MAMIIEVIIDFTTPPTSLSYSSDGQSNLGIGRDYVDGPYIPSVYMGWDSSIFKFTRILL